MALWTIGRKSVRSSNRWMCLCSGRSAARAPDRPTAWGACNRRANA